jgi:two-component system, LytTR family, response regulator AlgR
MSGALRIVIIDDEQPARERLRELLADVRDDIAVDIVGEAASGPQGLEVLAASPADVVLVDIHMPVMNGIEFARHAQGLEHPPAVVFITAHDQYAIEAFEVNAIDYLLKPVRAARLASSLKKAASGPRPAREQLAAADPGPRSHFSIAERGRVTLVPVDEVLFLKAELKYVTVRTQTREFLMEESLSQLEQELRDAFVRVHRNCLVARRAIRGVEQLRTDDEGESRWGLRVEGYAELIAVSRRQWPTVKALVRR